MTAPNIKMEIRIELHFHDKLVKLSDMIESYKMAFYLIIL